MNLVKSIMMSIIVVMGCSAISAMAGHTQFTPERLAERLAPTARPCVEGQDCQSAAPAVAPVAAAAAASAAPTGKQTYETKCFACHGTGVAPTLTDKAAWAPRLAQGIDTLYDHAINGFKGMPPRGTCGDCSDDDIKAAVDYMVAEVK